MNHSPTVTGRKRSKRSVKGQRGKISAEFMKQVKILLESAETKSDIDKLASLLAKKWRSAIKPNLANKLKHEYESLTEHFWVSNEDDFEFDTQTSRQARTSADKRTRKHLVMKTIHLKTGKVRWERIQVNFNWIDNASPQDGSGSHKYRLWTSEKKCKAYAKVRRSIESEFWDNLFQPANPAETLGLSIDYTEQELRAAWRRYANAHHPDKGGDAEKFRQGLAAYEALK